MSQILKTRSGSSPAALPARDLWAKTCAARLADGSWRRRAQGCRQKCSIHPGFANYRD